MANGQARLARVLARAAPQGETGEEWARELGSLLEAASRMTPTQPAGVAPARAVLAPFLAAAERWLEEESRHAGWTCLPSARSELLSLLAQRWVQPCLRPLLVEQHAIELVRPRSVGAPGFDSSAEAWLGRFEQYPVLAFLLPQTLLTWRAHVRELLCRLEQDRGLLADALFGGRPLPALAGMRGDAGDAHDGGRSVAVLRFEDGRQVVYKPKDLRVSRTVQDLFAWLNEAGLPIPLHARAVLPRDGYTWEEFVPEAPCRTADEVARFYTRMGMQLRLMQLLEARDLTLDNLVASGEYPVFIDTEMVLHPRRAGREWSRAEQRLEESVAQLGILSAVFPLAGGLGLENAGALTPAREFQTDLPHSPVLDALEGVQRASRQGYRVHKVWRHAPTLNGEPVHVAEQLPRLLAGYREMHTFLLAHRQGLLSDSSPLARFSGQKVRYVHRNTAAYMRPLLVGLSPELLAAPAKRRETLERLLESSGGGEEDPAVLQTEMAALQAMDVPYFLCPTDGSALLAPDGHVVSEAFFEGSGLERVQQRLRELELFPLDEHEALLRSTLETSRLLPPRLSPTSPREEQLSPPRWLDAALELGERVLAAALPEGERLSWLGLSYTPFHDHEELAPLGPDLLDGTAGLAVVLGELYAASGHDPFRTAALGALSHVRQVLASLPGTPSTPVGAFLGTGGHLYALARCAEVLRMPELLEEARTRAEALPLEELVAKAPPDVVAGTTGLALALTSCGATSLARAMLRGIGQQLASTSAPPLSYPPGSRASTRFPSPSEGLALQAARLGEPFPEPPLAELLTAGALLARVELAANGVGSREPVLAVVRSFLARSARDGVERLEQLEVALTASELLSDEASRGHAVQLGQRFLQGRVHSGRWFPERLAADHHQLSVLWGLPALARAFLRLHAPSRFPSLNLVRSVAP